MPIKSLVYFRTKYYHNTRWPYGYVTNITKVSGQFEISEIKPKETDIDYQWNFHCQPMLRLNITFMLIYFLAKSNLCDIRSVRVMVNVNYSHDQLLFCGIHSNLSIFSQSNKAVILLETYKFVHHKVLFIHAVTDHNILTSFSLSEHIPTQVVPNILFHRYDIH